jgi:hypothetical protein
MRPTVSIERYRRILIQGQMRAYLIVVVHVRQQDVSKVPFAQNDDMIDAFPSDRTDEPLCKLQGIADKDQRISIGRCD